MKITVLSASLFILALAAPASAQSRASDGRSGDPAMAGSGSSKSMEASGITKYPAQSGTPLMRNSHPSDSTIPASVQPKRPRTY